MTKIQLKSLNFFSAIDHKDSTEEEEEDKSCTYARVIKFDVILSSIFHKRAHPSSIKP